MASLSRLGHQEGRCWWGMAERPMMAASSMGDWVSWAMSGRTLGNVRMMAGMRLTSWGSGWPLCFDIFMAATVRQWLTLKWVGLATAAR